MIDTSLLHPGVIVCCDNESEWDDLMEILEGAFGIEPRRAYGVTFPECVRLIYHDSDQQFDWRHGNLEFYKRRLEYADNPILMFRDLDVCDDIADIASAMDDLY